MQLDSLLRMGLTMVPAVALMVAGGTLTISNPQLVSITCPEGRIDLAANVRFDNPQVSTNGRVRVVSPVQGRLASNGQATFCLTGLKGVTLDLPNFPAALSEMIRNTLGTSDICVDVTPIVSSFLGAM